MENYEELEGNTIEYIDGNVEYIGKVAGCEYDIGVSVVDKNNPDKYLICLIGPSAPVGHNPKNYNEAFNCVVEAIKSGRYEAGLLSEVRGKNIFDGLFGQFGECPFNQ